MTSKLSVWRRLRRTVLTIFEGNVSTTFVRYFELLEVNVATVGVLLIDGCCQSWYGWRKVSSATCCQTVGIADALETRISPSRTDDVALLWLSESRRFKLPCS